MSTFVLSHPPETTLQGLERPAPRWRLDWPPDAAPLVCAACGSQERIADAESFGGVCFCEACLEHVAQHALSPWYDDLGGGD